MTTLPVQRQSKIGCLTRLLLVFLLVGAVMAGVTYVFAPWSFYMGGRFHAIPMWQGWGRLHSNSGGGDYVLYVWFRPDSGRLRGLVYVKGQAVLCTPRGEKFVLNLGGDFGKPNGGWRGRDLNGKSASFYMFNRTASHILSGASARPELKLRGKWNDPDLVLDDDSSIQRNFDHDARLYPDAKNRPYLGEVSPITLHEGGKSDFEAACAAVKTH
jgi:hypothetical protein